jgi:hypothetical protein
MDVTAFVARYNLPFVCQKTTLLTLLHLTVRDVPSSQESVTVSSVTTIHHAGFLPVMRVSQSSGKLESHLFFLILFLTSRATAFAIFFETSTGSWKQGDFS